MCEALDSGRDAEPGRGGGCVVPASRGRCELQEPGLDLVWQPGSKTQHFSRTVPETFRRAQSRIQNSETHQPWGEARQPEDQTGADSEGRGRRSRWRQRTGQHSRDPGPVRSGTSLRPAASPALKKLNPDGLDSQTAQVLSRSGLWLRSKSPSASQRWTRTR